MGGIMKRSRTLAAAAAGLLMLSSVATTAGPLASSPAHSRTPAGIWTIFGCTGSIVFAALAANYAQKRQLTWNEAATCGLLYWFTPPSRRP